MTAAARTLHASTFVLLLACSSSPPGSQSEPGNSGGSHAGGVGSTQGSGGGAPAGGASTGGVGANAGGGQGGTYGGSAAGSSGSANASGGTVAGGAGASAGLAGTGGMAGAAGAAGGATMAGCGELPADTRATPETVALFCFLKTHQYVLGQTDMGDIQAVKQATGKTPAIDAFDFYGQEDQDTGTRNGQTDSGPIAWHIDKNGIASFQWHWRAPVQSSCGGSVQRGNYDTQWDFAWALDQPCSQLQKDLENTADQFARMAKAGVPVIYRPLHESNNNYMWWTKKGSDAYKKLFILEFQIMTEKTHNLLWVFNGMASDQSTPMSQWYPGDQYVDVVSSDYKQSQNDYDTLSGIGKHKLIAISETMDQINPDNAPPFAFSTVWASRDWGNYNAKMDEWKTAMQSSKAISLEKLPSGI